MSETMDAIKRIVEIVKQGGTFIPERDVEQAEAEIKGGASEEHGLRTKLGQAEARIRELEDEKKASKEKKKAPPDPDEKPETTGPRWPKEPEKRKGWRFPTA